MELQEFLEINGRNRIKGGGYDEVDVYDERGNPLTLWIGDDDPKYKAMIVKILPLSDEVVKIVIRYKGE